MYCRKCGQQLDDNSLFCNKCGYRVSDDNVVSKDEAKQKEESKFYFLEASKLDKALLIIALVSVVLSIIPVWVPLMILGGLLGIVATIYSIMKLTKKANANYFFMCLMFALGGFLINLTWIWAYVFFIF